jgi:hypothetical protein
MHPSSQAVPKIELHPVAMPAGSTHPAERGNPALFLGIYVVLLNLLLIYLLIMIWPGKIPVEPGKVRLLLGRWWEVTLETEIRYLLIVVLSGAMGSYIHLATSFADFVGNRKLKASWGWWYLVRPFIGMALALVVYFVVRAGLIGGAGGTSSMSPYGAAAIAGMCGLFSKQATDKLREVFENLFRTEKKSERADPLTTPKPRGDKGEGA